MKILKIQLVLRVDQSLLPHQLMLNKMEKS